MTSLSTLPNRKYATRSVPCAKTHILGQACEVELFGSHSLSVAGRKLIAAARAAAGKLALEPPVLLVRPAQRTASAGVGG